MSNGKYDALHAFFKSAGEVKKGEKVEESKARGETPPTVSETTESYLKQLRGSTESGATFSSFTSKEELKPEGDMDQYVSRVKQASTGNIYEQDLQNTPATMKDLGNLSQQIAANLQTSLTSLGGGGLGEKDVLQLIADNAPDVELDSAQLEKVIEELQGLMLDSSEVVLKAGDTMTGPLIIDNADLKVETLGSKIFGRMLSSPYGTTESLQIAKSGSVHLAISSGVTEVTNFPARYNNNATLLVGDNPYDLIHKEYAEELIISTVDSEYINNLGAIVYTDSDFFNRVRLTVDSAYVRSLQSFSAFDSDEVEVMIDSAVGEIVIPPFDSDAVQEMIDSAVGEIVIPSFDSDAVQDMIDSSISVGTNPFDQDLNTTDDVEFNKVASNLDGAIIFKAKNESGSPIAKGETVYISGVSGNTPLVDVADASDSDKMPAFGIAMETASDNSEIEIVTFGDLAGIDTQSYTVGDTLFVDTTPGQITNVKPTGASTKIQNIAYVTKVDNTTGRIKVGGAGRSAATPNLDAGQIFYGNGSGRSTPTLMTDVVDSAYIESRIDVVSPSSVGATVAAGRFKYSSSFSYDSAGAMPGSFVVNQFGISDIARTQAGRYTVVFDSDTATLLGGGHNYIVMTTIDYNGDNPTLSSRHIAVNGQTDDMFYLLAERSDNGTDGDYNDQSFVNFQVIRMN